eukprot:scaffold85778_cov48-Phaeocystis_antarctica.AAC.1
MAPRPLSRVQSRPALGLGRRPERPRVTCWTRPSRRVAAMAASARRELAAGAVRGGRGDSSP